MSRHTLAIRTLVVAAVSLVVVLMGAGAASAAPSSQDRTWMASAHQSNLTEIAAGKAAQSKATSQQVKDLGAMFVQMHTQLDADLTAGAQKLGVTLPSAPSATQQATLASVSSTSGAAFDSAWVTSQISGHRDALAAGKTEISSGSDASAIALATAAGPVVQQHLTALLALPQAPSSVQAGTGGQAVGDTSPWLMALAVVGVALVGAALLVPARRRQQG